MVIAPPNTGKDNNNKNAVTSNDQINKGNLSKDNPGALILNMVVIKLIAPIIDAAPAQCKLKITKSTEGPE